MESDMKLSLPIEPSGSYKLYLEYKKALLEEKENAQTLSNKLYWYISLIEHELQRDNILFSYSSRKPQNVDINEYDNYFDNIHALLELLTENKTITSLDNYTSNEFEVLKLQRDLTSMVFHIRYLENRIYELEHLSAKSSPPLHIERSFVELADELERKKYEIIELENKFKKNGELASLYMERYHTSEDKVKNLEAELQKVTKELMDLNKSIARPTCRDDSSCKNDSLFSDLMPLFVLLIIAIIFAVCIIMSESLTTISPSSKKNDSRSINSAYEYVSNNSSYSVMVWVDDTAKRYHKKNGCNMDNAYQVTIEEAEAMGKTPCGNCYR